MSFSWAYSLPDWFDGEDEEWFVTNQTKIYFFFLHQQSGEHWVWLEFSDMVITPKKFTVYHR